MEKEKVAYFGTNKCFAFLIIYFGLYSDTELQVHIHIFYACPVISHFVSDEEIEYSSNTTRCMTDSIATFHHMQLQHVDHARYYVQALAVASLLQQVSK